jgi:HNH endonuclease
MRSARLGRYTRADLTAPGAPTVQEGARELLYRTIVRDVMSRDWRAWWVKWRRRRHVWASAAAAVTFVVMTALGRSWGLPAVTAAVAAAIVITVGYFHFRRTARPVVAPPVTPARDDRVIPQDVKIAVSVRDKGLCQLKYPGICLIDRDIQFDHKWPWSKGGSSKDPDNIQCACGPCNRHKSDSTR